MKKRGLLIELVSHLLIPVYFAGLAASSSILLFQWFLTLFRERTEKFRNPPYFIPRSIFASGKEKPIISNKNWQKFKFKKTVDYTKINEGFGAAYERIAYTNILKNLTKNYRVKKVLELNATFIAGVPAFNSCILVQDGYDVTVTVHSRDWADAQHAWEIAGLRKKVKLIKWDDDFKTPFRKGQFDLVWNHLAVEHYSDPTPLLKEMKRVAKKLVVTMTLSPFNLGFIAHFLWHKAVGKHWDHGFIRNTLISTMEKLHHKVGLKVIESGACDDPTTPDTVDSKIGESMTYMDALPESVRGKWVWTAINPAIKNHWIVRFFWTLERWYPEWFRRVTAHHLYTASVTR